MTPLKPLALTALMLAVPALGFAGISTGDKLAITESEIRTMMEAKGYTVHEIEYEADKIEVEVRKDGVETEMVLSRTDGTVLKIEVEGKNDD